MKNLGFFAALRMTREFRMTREIDITSITEKWLSILAEELGK